MTTESIPPKDIHPTARPFRLHDYVPILSWAKQYRPSDLTPDLLAGLIVAIMLVPQSMAYALLAGLPPQIGLYAGILPLLVYGVFGTSRTLAVGPVAIVSLLVASSVAPLAEGGTAAYIQLALILALMTGLMQIGLGVLRAGFVVNFLSHPVLSGFTSAAAVIIGFSQLKHVLGFAVPRSEHFYQQIIYTFTHLGQINGPTLFIGVVSIGILVYFKHGLSRFLQRRGVPAAVALTITKAAPLVVVVFGTLTVWLGGWHHTAAVSIVGQVPAGLPPLTIPGFDLSVWQTLLPAAATISIVGYMESISVAKSLASRRREKINPDQELIGLGLANVAAAFTGGYPVTGGISRSVVNFSAGARTGLASIVTAVLIALTVLFLTPLFYYLPHAVLGAIILVAVSGLLDIATLRHVWHYNRADGVSLLVTFFSVLIFGVEMGILYGVIAAMLLYVWRTSRPHVAQIGRLTDGTAGYGNVLRHPTETWPHILAVRVDESLYFANTKYLEDCVLQAIADRPEVEHFVLIGTAVNFIDASALETLEALNAALRDAGVTLHIAGLKGPVMDRLDKSHFVDHIGAEHIHPTTEEAIQIINGELVN